MSLRPKSLILCDGDLPSLVAIASAAARRGLAGSAEPIGLWFLGGPADSWSLRHTAFVAQADVFGLPGHVPSGQAAPSVSATPVSVDQMVVRSVLDAAWAASASGCQELIWPQIAQSTPEQGLDLSSAADTADRALLMSRLVSLGAERQGRSPVRIHTPYADLVDRQIADLVLDMDVPVWLCWWTGSGARDIESAVAERRRWQRALESAGWTGDLPEPDPAARSIASSIEPKSIPRRPAPRVKGGNT